MSNKRFYGWVCPIIFPSNENIRLNHSSLGDYVDLIFVLFDPIGQALCKRTLTLVEQLNKSNPQKMHYYLAKADEAGSDRDRHRVLMQIVQNLCRQPEISKTNFDMPTIYLPDLAKARRNFSGI
jgi:hypothetical protein